MCTFNDTVGKISLIIRTQGRDMCCISTKIELPSVCGISNLVIWQNRMHIGKHAQCNKFWLYMFTIQNFYYVDITL